MKDQRRIITNRKEREISIKIDTPAVFPIKRNSSNLKNNILNNIFNLDYLGNRAIKKHNEKILEQSKKHNLDPDLIRSVMYAENARGHKFGLNWFADQVKTSESPMPMNIQKNRWADLIDKKPEDLYDKDDNIEAGTVLLKRLRDRVPDASPEKIGTLWNNIGDNETNAFGEYVGSLYRKKPWAVIE